MKRLIKLAPALIIALNTAGAKKLLDELPKVKLGDKEYTPSLSYIEYKGFKDQSKSDVCVKVDSVPADICLTAEKKDPLHVKCVLNSDGKTGTVYYLVFADMGDVYYANKLLDKLSSALKAIKEASYKYVMDKKTYPSSLDDLINAGYLDKSVLDTLNENNLTVSLANVKEFGDSTFTDIALKIDGLPDSVKEALSNNDGFKIIDGNLYMDLFTDVDKALSSIYKNIVDNDLKVLNAYKDEFSVYPPSTSALEVDNYKITNTLEDKDGKLYLKVTLPNESVAEVLSKDYPNSIVSSNVLYVLLDDNFENNYLNYINSLINLIKTKENAYYQTNNKYTTSFSDLGVKAPSYMSLKLANYFDTTLNDLALAINKGAIPASLQTKLLSSLKSTSDANNIYVDIISDIGLNYDVSTVEVNPKDFYDFYTDFSDFDTNFEVAGTSVLSKSPLKIRTDLGYWDTHFPASLSSSGRYVKLKIPINVTRPTKVAILNNVLYSSWSGEPAVGIEGDTLKSYVMFLVPNKWGFGDGIAWHYQGALSFTTYTGYYLWNILLDPINKEVVYNIRTKDNVNHKVLSLPSNDNTYYVYLSTDADSGATEFEYIKVHPVFDYYTTKLTQLDANHYLLEVNVTKDTNYPLIYVVLPTNTGYSYINIIKADTAFEVALPYVVEDLTGKVSKNGVSPLRVIAFKIPENVKANSVYKFLIEVK